MTINHLSVIRYSKVSSRTPIDWVIVLAARTRQESISVNEEKANSTYLSQGDQCSARWRFIAWHREMNSDSAEVTDDMVILVHCFCFSLRSSSMREIGMSFFLCPRITREMQDPEKKFRSVRPEHVKTLKKRKKSFYFSLSVSHYIDNSRLMFFLNSLFASGNQFLFLSLSHIIDSRSQLMQTKEFFRIDFSTARSAADCCLCCSPFSFSWWREKLLSSQCTIQTVGNVKRRNKDPTGCYVSGFACRD